MTAPTPTPKMNADDLYDDPRYDQYDVCPLKTRPAGGAKHVPFHTGKGTRQKIAAAEAAASAPKTAKTSKK